MRFGIAAAAPRRSTSPRGNVKRTGCFPFMTMVLVSTLIARSKSLESSSVFTPPTNMPAPAWALPSVNVSSSAQGGGSGSNPRLAGDRRFTLPSPAPTLQSTGKDVRAFTIILVEDNRADAGLVRESLIEHGVPGELIVFSD